MLVLVHGRLSTSPYTDSWQFIQDWKAMEKAMVRLNDPHLGLTRDMRRQAKARTFTARYSGAYIDPVSDLAQRMKVKHPPLSYPNEY